MMWDENMPREGMLFNPGLRFGAIPMDRLKSWGSLMEIPEGIVTSAGPWDRTVDLVIRNCSSRMPCSAADTLQTVLSLEEDPATVVVVMSTPFDSLSSLAATVHSHKRCLGADAASHKICRGDSSISFRRHAAYDAGRIGGAAFMQHFSAHFETRETCEASGSCPMVSAVATAGFRNFKALLTRDPQAAEVVRQWLAERRRLVACVVLGGADAQQKSALRSLLQQRPMLSRLYLFVKSRGTRCAARRFAHWFRLRVICGQEHPLTALLSLELRGDTLILLVGVRRHRPQMLSELLQAFHLWPGHAVARLGDENEVPLSDEGMLLQRSFLDSRLLDHLPSERKLGAVVKHLQLKGIGWKLLKGKAGSRKGQQLGTRRVLFVLLPRTEALLALVLRLAAAQTRQLQELVLVSLASRTGGFSAQDGRSGAEPGRRPGGRHLRAPSERPARGDVAAAAERRLAGQGRLRASPHLQLPQNAKLCGVRCIMWRCIVQPKVTTVSCLFAGAGASDGTHVQHSRALGERTLGGRE
ncbi:unnamed protein product [Effrenium voratum]|nr:unnamed protein product [Effrenium voratum]